LLRRCTIRNGLNAGEWNSSWRMPAAAIIRWVEVAVDPKYPCHLASPHHIVGSQVGSDNEELALGRSCL
jgi:hypothetical protein